VTALNAALAPKLCAYCGNSDGVHCLADVPWYCASVYCKYYRENPPKAERPVKRRRVNPLRYLVETF
jgi:hypothetical protein